MSTNTLRPWLEPVHAHFLTAQDLAQLDATYNRWVDSDRPNLLGVDLVAYIRDKATEMAKVRDIIGQEEIPLPDFIGPVDRFTEWERNPSSNDCYREIDAFTNELGSLEAILEVEQWAISGRLNARVRVEEGYTDDPDELIRWATGLLELAHRINRIRDGKS